MRKNILLPLAALAVALSSQSVAAADPSIQQVHAAAVSGRMDQALTMMQEVLRDHPDSAKAHYIEAQLLAATHRIPEARIELANSERIAPGLPFASPGSVAELKQVIATGGLQPRFAASTEHSGFPWLMIILAGILFVFAVALFRRRQVAAPYAGSPDGGGLRGSGGYVPQSGPWSGPAAGSGMGSGIMGSLASGAALGAGFAAGETVIDRMFGGERRPRSGADELQNQDMGGNDFGITDSGSWGEEGTAGGDW